MDIGQMISALFEWLRVNAPDLYTFLSTVAAVIGLVLGWVGEFLRPVLNLVDSLIQSVAQWMNTTFGLQVPTSISRPVQLGIVLITLWSLKRISTFTKNRRYQQELVKQNEQVAIDTMVAVGVSKSMIDDALNGRSKSKYTSSEFVREIKDLVQVIQDLTPEGRQQLQAAFSPEFQKQMARGLSLELQAVVKRLEIIRDCELNEHLIKAKGISLQVELMEIIKQFQFLEDHRMEFGWSEVQLRKAKANQAAIAVAKYTGVLSGGKVSTTDAVIISGVADTQTLLSTPEELATLPTPRTEVDDLLEGVNFSEPESVQRFLDEFSAQSSNSANGNRNGSKNGKHKPAQSFGR